MEHSVSATNKAQIITPAEFESLRAQIISKLPSHKKALTGPALKDAAAKAWIADHR